MGWLSNLIGGGAAAGAGQIVKDTGSAVGGLAKDIRTAITGIDPDKAAELEKLAVELEKTVAQAQAAINEKEAQSARFFVAGWRPAVGWICAVSLAIYYWPRFIAGMVLWVGLAVRTGTLPPAPDLGIADILGLLVPLIGLGALRTVEKTKEVENRH